MLQFGIWKKIYTYITLESANHLYLNNLLFTWWIYDQIDIFIKDFHKFSNWLKDFKKKTHLDIRQASSTPTLIFSKRHLKHLFSSSRCGTSSEQRPRTSYLILI